MKIISVILVILTGLLFGRPLERALPGLAQQIPYIIFAFWIGFALWQIKRLRDRVKIAQVSKEGETTESRVSPLYPLLSLSLPLGFLGAGRYLTRYPVEYLHLAKYGLLVIVIFEFLKSKPRLRDRAHSSAKLTLTATLLATAIGVAEENSQRFVPNRFYDPWDILLNVSGCLFGALFIWIQSSIWRQDSLR